jgi:enoyl-CoA hydratase/carnithine racemase
MPHAYLRAFFRPPACLMKTMTPTLSQVRVERTDQVATISINRPKELNTVTPALVQQLRWAFDDASADKEILAIFIAGEGKVFSVGAEISFLLRNLESGDFSRIMAVTYAAHELFNIIDDCPKPVIARIHGVTIGAGLELALCCDRIVACPQATFSFPETGLGIFPCLGGTQRASRAVGAGLAKWMMYTGKSISAADALGIGLVDDVVGAHELDAVCHEHAFGKRSSKRPHRLSAQYAQLADFFERHRVDDLHAGKVDAAGDPALIRALKSIPAKGLVALRFVERLIDEGLPRSLAEGLQMEIELVPEIYRTADAYRGLTYRAQNKLGTPQFDGR